HNNDIVSFRNTFRHIKRNDRRAGPRQGVYANRTSRLGFIEFLTTSKLALTDLAQAPAPFVSPEAEVMVEGIEAGFLDIR
ncbi:hypothetical protein, partial [Sulfitobacter sp. HI0076]|uniref:hypothetical protein n=1 Tax=Sulfitobacter sp. HI0076 TaxID=1822251 RepID=UPI000B05C573